MLRRAGEGLVLLMVCLSPWAFGADEPVFEFALDVGVGVLLLFWAARMLLEWRLTWKKCPVALCLACLFLVGVWQMKPLPRELLGRLSPATARTYKRFLPAQPEVLPAGEQPETVLPPAGSTLSLYPGATRREAVRLLAVFLLFAVVRNTIASAAALRRLSIAVLVNGALLAGFGLVQFFTSAPNTLYWTFPSPGQVFGPFVNRNHFAFYLNLCAGLGLGLLLQLRYARPEQGGPTSVPTDSSPPRHRERGRISAPLRSGAIAPVPRGLLEDPPALWATVALALVLSSVVFSLSRGGLVALLGGAIICLAIGLVRFPGFWRAGTLLLAIAMTLGLVGWFGFERVSERVATLWTQGEPSRFRAWSNALEAVKDFPVWGTGYGTFPYVELWHRRSAEELGLVYDHAHNEYVEALVEGGLLRLCLSLLAIVLVCRLGYRAVRGGAGRGVDLLALGALFALTTTIIHSFVEFGLHIPAIAVLAAVLCADLCAVGRAAGRPSGTTDRAEEGAADDEYRLRLGGLAPLAGAITAAAFGLALASQGWNRYQSHRYWTAGLRLGAAADPAVRDRQIAYLDVAALGYPDSLRLQNELGRVHTQAAEERAEELARPAPVHSAVQAWTAALVSGRAPSPGQVALTAAGSVVASPAAWDERIRAEAKRAAGTHGVAALRHYLHARDLCPIVGEAQLGIYAGADQLERGDPPDVYLNRAEVLIPFDPELWYLIGIRELLQQDPQAAAQSWRRSLELSDRFLAEIVDRSGQRLGAQTLLDEVLPDRPALLLAAAGRLYPSPAAADQRRPFLEKALGLLEHQPGPPKAEDLRLKALIYAALNRQAEAAAAYRAALVRAPQQTAWRFEFAQFLLQQGRWDEAYRELRTVLEQQPQNGQARASLEFVARKRAEGAAPP